MSAHIVMNSPRAVRNYTCSIDGTPVTKSFYHGAGLSPNGLNATLNRQFHTWLEIRAPGALAAGRVHGIQFEDGVA
jgi:hypothetical protein